MIVLLLVVLMLAFAVSNAVYTKKVSNKITEVYNAWMKELANSVTSLEEIIEDLSDKIDMLDSESEAALECAKIFRDRMNNLKDKMLNGIEKYNGHLEAYHNKKAKEKVKVSKKVSKRGRPRKNK